LSVSNFNETDLRILQVLQEDARISNTDLAARVGLSPSPCHRRVRLIEAAGIIRQYVALLDRRRLGLGLAVFVDVSLGRKDPKSVAAFERAVAARPEVMEILVLEDVDSDFEGRTHEGQCAVLRVVARKPGG